MLHSTRSWPTWTVRQAMPCAPHCDLPAPSRGPPPPPPPPPPPRSPAPSADGPARGPTITPRTGTESLQTAATAEAYEAALASVIDALVLVLDVQPDLEDRWTQLAQALALAQQTETLLDRYKSELAWWRHVYFRGAPASAAPMHALPIRHAHPCSRLGQCPPGPASQAATRAFRHRRNACDCSAWLRTRRLPACRARPRTRPGSKDLFFYSCLFCKRLQAHSTRLHITCTKFTRVRRAVTQ